MAAQCQNLSGGALPPVSADFPCGPNLEDIGDKDFINFIVTTEGLLPTDYPAFDRGTINFPEAIAAGDALLARSHDVRLLVLLAKLAILNRDLYGFAARIETLAWLLVNHWDEAHPCGNKDSLTERMAHLHTLDDLQTIVLPLRNASLISSEREKSVSFNAYLSAPEKPNTRRPHNFYPWPIINMGWTYRAIYQIVADAELAQLAHAYETVLSIRAFVAEIERLALRRSSFEEAPRFDGFSSTIEDMRSFLGHAVWLHFYDLKHGRTR